MGTYEFANYSLPIYALTGKPKQPIMGEFFKRLFPLHVSTDYAQSNYPIP